jgi:tetratricopeptide (TPR) repeat protein
MEMKTHIPVTGEQTVRPRQEGFSVPSAPERAFAPRDVRQSVNPQPAPATRKDSWSVRFFDGVATVSLMALFFGLPLFFTGMTLQGLAFDKQMYFYLWLLVGIVAWAAKAVIQGEMKIRRTPLDIPLLIFLGAYIASLFFSVDRWHSFWGSFGEPSRGLLSILSLILAYYFIFSHFTPRRFALMLGSLIAASFLVVLWVFLVTLGIHFLPASWEAFVPLTPIGTVSATVLFLGCVLPLFIVAISKVQSSEGKVALRWVVTGLLLVGLGMALFSFLALYNYVSWWAILIGFGFFLVYVLAQIARLSEKWAWLPMLVLVLLLTFFMVGKNELARVQFPVEAKPNFKLSWEVAKEGVKERFLVGSGPGTYGYAFAQHRPVEYNLQPLFTFRFFQGSGFLFEALPTIGVIGVVALGVLLFSFLSVGFYLLSQGREQNKVYSLGLWSAVLVLALGAAVVPVNASLLLLSVLMGTLALAVLLWESRSEEGYLHLSLKSSPKFALALAFIFIVVSAGVAFMFVFLGKAFVADVSAAQSLRQNPITESESAAKMLKALQYMPQEGRYYGNLSQIYMALANQEAAKAEGERDLEKIKRYVDAASRLANTAKTKMPNDILVQETVAQTYENTAVLAAGDPQILEQVQKEYDRAVELDPNNPIYYLKLGQVKRALANGQKPEEQTVTLSDAKSLFEKAIEKKKDFGIAYLSLGLTQEALKDVDGAISNMEKAVVAEKNNVDFRFNLARLYRIRAKDEDLKRAEALLKEALKENEKALNLHLNLGLVYEKTNRKDEAIQSYRKVLEVLAGDEFKTAREQVQVLIDNVQAGKPNVLADEAVAEAAAPAPVGETGGLTSQPAPTAPPAGLSQEVPATPQPPVDPGQ